MSERLTTGGEKSHGGTVERIRIEGTVKLTLEVGLEIVIRVKVVWRVEDVIKDGSLRVLKNGGEEFSCECEATMSVPAHKVGAAGPKCFRD